MKKKKAIFRWLILAISVLFLLIFLNSSKETSVIKQLGAKIFKTKAENSTEDITIPRLNINGDGIDSNGYIYINGGTVYAFAHPGSDNGLDSDLGTYINGGTVLSTGSMYEETKTSN